MTSLRATDPLVEPAVATPDVTGPSRRMPRIQPTVVVSVLVLAAALVAAFAPGVFTSYDPVAAIPADRLTPPSAEHWFGTDYLGRDLFSRTVYGSALSLQAALVAVVFALVTGSAIGLLAGFVGGAVESIVMRLVDVLLAIPGILLSLAVIIVLGFGTVNVAIAVGVAAIAGFARLMRAEVIQVRTSVFVEAARASGARWYRVLFRHVLPHSTGAVLVLATLEFGTAVLSVSALSFLGFGAPPPTPEWGSLIAEGRSYLATSPWLTALPGLVVVAVVLSANRLGRAAGVRRKAKR